MEGAEMEQLVCQEKPLIICGHRKSGTTLLLSLFDSHEELCVFPPDSGFFYGYYPVYDDEGYSDEEKKQRIIDTMFFSLKKDLKKVAGDRCDDFPCGEAEKRFLERMKGQDCRPSRLLAEAVFAFNDVRGGKNSDIKRWVEKTTSTEIYAYEIFNWFPDAKMIHVIRDPRDNYASLKSGWVKRYAQYNDAIERLLQSMIERGGLGFKLAKANVELYGEERYKVVRYEDLIAAPEKVMSELAAFVGISSNESLLKPTYFGLPWGGNNFEGKVFTRPDGTNANKWKSRITEHEASVLEFYFGVEMERWGYEPCFSSDKCAIAAGEHYKWTNFNQEYSVTEKADTFKTE